MSLRDVKYRELYERLAQEGGDFDDAYYGPGGTSGGWGDRLLDHVIRRLPPCRDGVFADVGCADGRLLVMVAERMRSRVGVDVSRLRLTRARTKLSGVGGKTVLLQGFVERMPIASRSIAVAVCLETLEHVLETEPALAELRRVLVPSGHLFISVPSVTLRSYWEMYRLRRPFYCDEKEHLREFTARPITWFPNKFILTSDLEAQLVRHGLTVIERSGVGYLFPRWADRTALTRWTFDLLYTRRLNPLFGYIPFVRRFPRHTVYHLVAP
jgi:SAM-dependent methyltransferase